MNTTNRSTAHRLNEWHKAAGKAVEIRHNGELQHHGFVDEVMTDGSGLWLATYGISLRIFVQKHDDVELWLAGETLEALASAR